MKRLLIVLVLGLLVSGVFPKHLEHKSDVPSQSVTINEKKSEPTISTQVASAESTARPDVITQTPPPNYKPVYPASRQTYIDYARSAATRVGVRPALLLAQINHESGFNPTAVSPTGDYGIAQINLASHQNISVSEAFDPYWSINWMAANMGEKVHLYGEFEALVTYNCGHPYCSVSYSYAQTILNQSNLW